MCTIFRPTTRTTKTISDTSESSRSSMADKSAMREYQIESYISFHSELGEHVRGATDHLYSPDDTIASESIFSDRVREPTDHVFDPNETVLCDKILSDLSDENSETVSRLHETHFGDSLSDIPRTVIHSPSLQISWPPRSFQTTGKTIFDCEQGCFVTVEEYQKKNKKKHPL